MATVRRALELGVDVFDTAPAYGDSEAVLGRALGDARDRVLIATKCPPLADPLASLESSLRRLRTDRVDLLQLHELADGWEGRLEEMARLADRGLARGIGICNATPGQLARALEIAPLASCQGALNLVDRDAEEGLLPLCRKRGVAFLAYRPLAAGLLAGRAEAAFGEGDHRSRIYWFRGRELERRQALLERLRPIAAEAGRTLPGLALGWTLARPGVSIVLAGARTLVQAEENATATPLDAGTVEEVDAAVRDVFRPPAATAAARGGAAGWGERERFIVERLDGSRTYEAIAAEHPEDHPLTAAQVKVFADDLVERGLAR